MARRDLAVLRVKLAADTGAAAIEALSGRGLLRLPVTTLTPKRVAELAGIAAAAADGAFGRASGAGRRGRARAARPASATRAATVPAACPRAGRACTTARPGTAGRAGGSAGSGGARRAGSAAGPGAARRSGAAARAARPAGCGVRASACEGRHRDHANEREDASRTAGVSDHARRSQQSTCLAKPRRFHGITVARLRFSDGTRHARPDRAGGASGPGVHFEAG
jgi:hypothetical protein